jgi:uncharacterized DUF497 family protein
MTSKLAGFDWDDGNRTKCQKHGVTIAEIESFSADKWRFARTPAVPRSRPDF